jgi:hypothetical protein
LSDNSGLHFRISSGTEKSIVSGGRKTKCGKFIDDVPGRPRTDTLKDVDCRLCQTGFQSFVEFEQSQQHWRRLAEENAQARAEQDRLWWDQYSEYLLTDTWNAKRIAVLERANHACEGCGQAKATQAHHLEYSRQCAPGSEAWISQEKLFNLVAVCRQCHLDLH